jgi:predicted flap endonuclease-1-like 5' DNA nuclease
MEILAALVGAGLIAASPFLPVLRPAAKAAVKGGMAVSEAVVGAAVVVGTAVSKKKPATDEDVDPEAETTAEESPLQDSETPETSEAQEAVQNETNGQAAGLSSLAAALRPTAASAVKAGMAMSDKAKEAVVATGKRWNELVDEARESQGKTAEEQIITVTDDPQPEVAAETPVKKAAKAKPAAKAQPATKAKATAKAKTAPAPTPDDLTKIKGIGPKTAELLQNSGITTYAQLGAAGEPQLRQILDDAGSRYRSINPADWPEEARGKA